MFLLIEREIEFLASKGKLKSETISSANNSGLFFNLECLTIQRITIFC